MWNLTFDPCLKVKGLQTVQTAHGKSWPANVLRMKNFGLILKKKKMVAIADCLKISKMLR